MCCCSMLFKPDGSKVGVTTALLWQQKLIHRMHIADRGHSNRIKKGPLIPNADSPDNTVALWLKWLQMQFIRISFTPVPRVLFIHTTRQLKVGIWHYLVTECSFTAHKMHFPKQNHGSTVLAKCIICGGEKVNRNEVSVGPICST